MRVIEPAAIRTVVLAALIALSVTPARTEPRDDSALQAGLEGALRGCETWILDPSTWLDGTAPFLRATGLGLRIAEADGVIDALLPPPEMRRGARYWRIAGGPASGYVLSTSTDVPMCHISGGGPDDDLQPVVEAVIASTDFAARWRETNQDGADGMTTTTYVLRAEPKLTLVFSRADAPGARRDRPQVLATALYDLPAR